MKSVDLALAQWLANGVLLQPGIVESIVLTKLRAVGRHASSDVVSLFASVNGMSAGECDDHVFSLWSIDQAISEASSYEEHYLPFADFLLSSSVFLLRYESAERSSVWIQYDRRDVARQVAASVAEFFDFLVHAPDSVEVVL